MLNYIVSISNIYLLRPTLPKNLCESVLGIALGYLLVRDVIDYMLPQYKYSTDLMSKFVYNGYPTLSAILQKYTREERKYMFSRYNPVSRGALLPLAVYKDELEECNIDLLQIADIVHIPFTNSGKYVPTEVWRYWLNTEEHIDQVIPHCYMYSEFWLDISNNISRLATPCRQLHNLIVLILLKGMFDANIYNAWSKYAIILTDDMLDAGLIHWLANNKEKAFDYLCKSSQDSMSRLRSYYSDEFDNMCKSFESNYIPTNYCSNIEGKVLK